MQYLVTAQEMKKCDRNTIKCFGMDSMVLMERAALAAAARVYEWTEKTHNTTRALRVLVVFGHGNNAGDGIAIGRILGQHGYKVSFMQVGESPEYSEETAKQLKIIKAYGYQIDTFSNIRENISQVDWDIIIDAMFGIGCNRPLENEYAQTVAMIETNKLRNGDNLLVCSVDMPSGISSDNGQVCGTAVHADITVTFNYAKIGQMMYPGCTYVGKLYVEDAGISKEGFMGEMPKAFFYDEDAKELLPERNEWGNKSTFGRILVIAGNSEISGACTMCAMTCYRSGAGMVRVLTAQENRETLQTTLPEALLDTYGADESADNLQNIAKMLRKAMEWSSVICMGPGIGTGTIAKYMLQIVLTEYEHNLILDADALNILSMDKEMESLAGTFSSEKKWLIMTPHVAEFARLYGSTTRECKANILNWPAELSRKYHCSIICKDARSVVTDESGSHLYINISGNSGMATAGSGDVLTGLLGALGAMGMDGYTTACIGCYLHGVAGDIAAKEYGEYYMLAGDIMRSLQSVFPQK